MASHLNITELQIGTTQTITGISTSINSSNSTIPTSKAVKDFVDNLSKPVSLSVVGNWANPQYISQPVDTAGLIFIVTYGSGKTTSVTPSVSPSSWSSTAGTQTATFSYTENGVTVSATKTCNMTYSITVSSGGNGSCSGSTTYVYSSSSQTKSISYSPNSGYTFDYWSVSGGSASASGTTLTINGGSTGNITVTGYFKVSWTAQTITLTNPNSSLVFRSISGNLYTNSSCTTKATTNRKYTWSTYYYKSNETRPSGSYLYDYGDGKAGSGTTSEEPPQDTITSYYNEGSLTACLGTSGYCWSGTMYYIGFFYRINLSNGSWEIASPSKSYHRVRESTF